jgi:hypothetical protein
VPAAFGATPAPPSAGRIQSPQQYSGKVISMPRLTILDSHLPVLLPQDLVPMKITHSGG